MFHPEPINAISRRAAAFLSKKPALSNYFGALSDGAQIYEDDDVLLVRVPEANHHRLFVMSTHADCLRSRLRLLEGCCVSNIPTKSAPGILGDIFLDAGFAQIGHYRRMFQAAPQACDAQAECFAELQDFAALRDLIDRHFSPYTDYPPSDTMLTQMITEGRVIVRREGGHVVAAILFTVTGKRGYLNIWVARLHGMRVLKDFYNYLSRHQLNLSLWVNASNARAIDRYLSTGAKFDGMNDYSFLKNAQNVCATARSV